MNNALYQQFCTTTATFGSVIMKNDQYRAEVVYEHSRINSRVGVAKMYFVYWLQSVRTIVRYILKSHPTMPIDQRLAQIKPIRTIASECLSSWRKWREFPFSYFINYLWLETSSDFSNVDEFVPLVRHELERDRSVTIRSKAILSSKIYMSKLLRDWGIPQPTPIVYGENARLFCVDGNVIAGQSDLARATMALSTGRIFAKFDVSYGGLGIQCYSRDGTKYYCTDGNEFNYDSLRKMAETADFVCQEGLQQVPELNALVSDSINTLRIMTVFRTDTVDVVAVVLRTGRKGSFVDNGTVGGLSCHVDIESWRTKGTAVLWNSHPYEFHDRHPDTGTIFDGIQLPFRDETLHLVRKLAARFPGCEVIGWDVSLTPSGPMIVEANWNPDVELPQMSAKTGLARLYFPSVHGNTV